MKRNRKSNPLEASVSQQASEFNIKSALVALSGGADSVTTAYVLKKAGLKIKALHCNFHLRGKESDRDMEFVKNFCQTHSIPCEIIEFDVKSYMLTHKGESPEIACRNLRHQWFKEKLIETGFDRLVTGHNADDNIETFFLNMLRGSGTRGLKGMEKDNGYIWRPLLYFHRIDILCYLQKNNLSYVVDSTNLKSDYRRNFLRNKVIPLFKEEWKGFDVAMDKTIRNIESENRMIESVIKNAMPLPNEPLPAESILNAPAPLLLLQRFIDPIGPFSTTAQEILSSIKANKPHIRRWRLRNGAVFLRNGNLFIEMGHGEGSA